jgi:5-carboxymethyl-2-hydroxymuconate isomerase
MKKFVAAVLDNLTDNGRNSAYVSACFKARRGYQDLHLKEFSDELFAK